MDDKIRFPFQAKCIVAKVVSPLLRGETVEVRAHGARRGWLGMLVLMRSHGRNVAVPLPQLTPADTDESTTAAISDWHYWVAQGYCF